MARTAERSPRAAARPSINGDGHAPAPASADDVRALAIKRQAEQENEQLLLASLLRDPSKVRDVHGLLNPSDFFADAHQRVFRAILKLDIDRELIDYPSLYKQIERVGDLADVGVDLLVKLIEMRRDTSDPMLYAVRVCEQWKDRERQRLLCEFAARSEMPGCSQSSNTADLRAQLDRVEYRSTESKKSGWKWDLIDSAAFARGDFRPTWIVKRMIVDREPLILGGAEKTLKTTIAAELAVSVSTGLPFLGRFDAYQPRPVAFVSGESGRFSLQDMFLRIATAKGVDPDRCEVHWGFNLPSLADPDDLAEIEAGILRNRIGLCIIDPAYLAVLRGVDANDAKNFFRMGQILSDFSAACIRGGATPAIVHHANRTLAPGDVMDLTHLSYSGFSHFAGQWLLLSRRSRYEGDGKHELTLNAGGRCGQGGLYSIEIDEGTIGDDFSGRKWQVAIAPAGEQRERDAAERETEKDRKKTEKAQKDADELHGRWLKQPDRTSTKGHMRGVMGGWSGDRMNLAVAFLADRRRLLPCDAEVPSGRYGTKVKKVAGFVAVSGPKDAETERVGNGG